jgi:subtilase family serine protease
MQQDASADRAYDIGHRDARKPVSVVLLLRYNRQAELTRLLASLERQSRPHYLTHQQFMQRFAPTAQQERQVARALRASGFTIVRTYPNHTLIDVQAPTATVERFFSTQIHDFRQRGAIRVANIRPLRVPAALESLVAGADASGIASMRAVADIGDTTFREPDVATNLLRNPSFATGKLSPWQSCTSGPRVPGPAISTVHPHSGKYDALAGTTNAAQVEVNGTSTVCQLVTIPTDAKLHVWVYDVSNDTHTKLVEQFGGLFNESGKLVKELFTFDRTKRWTQLSFDLSTYAGKRYFIGFGVKGTLKDKKSYIGQWVDDVVLTGIPVTPTPSPAPTPKLGPGGGWGPTWETQGFDFPSIDGDAGQNQTIANVIDQPVSQSDISSYMQYFGLTQSGTVTTENSVDCNASTFCGADPSNKDVIEATLDVETMVGLAPAANVIVYLLPDGGLSDTAIEDTYNQIVGDAKATVVNSSFGGCESQSSAFDTMTDQIAEQGSATGVTFSASSGDTGVTCFDGTESNPVGVQAPASDPHFVAVGGTQSNLVPGKTSITNPVVWNDDVGSGGGGVSTFWTTVPSYQSTVAGVSPKGRNVPDIALPAANDDIYIAEYGGWGAVWGTSWSSPIYVAMQSEINQTCGSAQWGINALYNAFAKTAYQYDFIDVTSGNNSYGGAAGYSADTGFDQASGIGMPLGSEVAIDNGCGTR